GNRNELRIRGLTGGGIIEVSALANSIVISAASFTQNITNSAFGGGINPILAISANSEIHTRTFTGGGIVEVSAATDGRIIVSAANIVNLNLSSLGTGTDIITTISGSEIIQRRIQGAGSIDVRTSSNGVLIVSSLDTSFIESNFKLIMQRNFNTSPGVLVIGTNLSAYNEVYITFFNIAPQSSNAPLAFRMKINGLLVTTGNLYRYNTLVIKDVEVSSNFVQHNQTLITGNLENGGSTKRRRSTSGYIRIFSPNTLNMVSAGTTWISEARWISSIGEEIYKKTVGRNLYSTNTGTKFEGIEIYIDGANTFIDTGLMKVYGRI
ncbi:MAG: hypothetical protein QXG00_08635, partial [Candidatus Woesearchaeota archaeon]